MNRKEVKTTLNTMKTERMTRRRIRIKIMRKMMEIRIMKLRNQIDIRVRH